MSCWQKIKLVGPLLLFNILLPTWDVFSDVKLSVNLMMGGSQSCSIEEENVKEFRQELGLCLKNPQEYCQNQNDSIASYLCRYQSTSTCMLCRSVPIDLKGTFAYGHCDNPNEGIRENYYQCFNNKFINSDNYNSFNSHGQYSSFMKNGSRYDYCSDPETYHGICEEITRRHYIFAIMLLGNYEEFYVSVVTFLFYFLAPTGAQDHISP